MTRYVLILLLAAGAVLAQDAPAEKKDAAPAASGPSKPAAPPKPKMPPRVRTGYVVKAEFTSEKPSAESSSPVSKKSSSAWAVLTLQLDPGRAASIFDYELSKDGTAYPCLDLTEGDGEFAGKLRIYSSPESKKCRLVFAVPSAEDEYEINFKLVSDQETPVKLNVKPPPPPPEEKKSEEKKADEKQDGEKKSESAPAE